MTNSRCYMNALQKKCRDMTNSELREMANDVDSDIGSLLYFSFINKASFETVEKHAALRGDSVPVSRRSSYRKRKQYIDMIERRQTAAGIA